MPLLGVTMVFHGIPIPACENISPPHAAAFHLLYTVYPPTTPEAGVAQAEENATDIKEVNIKSTTAM